MTSLGCRQIGDVEGFSHVLVSLRLDSDLRLWSFRVTLDLFLFIKKKGKPPSKETKKNQKKPVLVCTMVGVKSRQVNLPPARGIYKYSGQRGFVKGIGVCFSHLGLEYYLS